MASPSSSPLELTLSLKPSYMPKTIQKVLKDLQEVKNPLDKLLVLNDYIQQHKEELNFIQQIKHEVPQCGLFLMDAIKTLTEESEKIKKSMELGEGQPVVEFFSTKRKEYENDFAYMLFTTNNESMRQKRSPSQIQQFNEEKDEQFFHYKESFNQIPHNNELPNNNPILPFNYVEEQSFHGSSTGWGAHTWGARGLGSIIPRAEPTAHGNQNLRFQHQTIDNYQTKPLTKPIKNSRMTWTEKLHDIFVEAVKLSGGIEVATPKHIREIMQVEGLTNDQIKSHLQKYRLHYRRDPEDSS